MTHWQRRNRDEQDHKEFGGALGGGGSVCVHCLEVEFAHAMDNTCQDGSGRKYKSERMAKTEESELERSHR